MGRTRGVPRQFQAAAGNLPCAQPFFPGSAKENRMKARSRAQQRAAGAALSAKRGETSKRKLKGASKDMVETMTEAELEDMASMKHAGKPERIDPREQGV
jgi:hypothetical protein